MKLPILTNSPSGSDHIIQLWILNQSLTVIDIFASNFGCDARDRLATIAYPDSNTSTFPFDARVRRTSLTDQTGKFPIAWNRVFK